VSIVHQYSIYTPFHSYSIHVPSMFPYYSIPMSWIISKLESICACLQILILHQCTTYTYDPMMLPAGHRRHRVHGAPENLSPHFVPSPPQLFLKAERPGPGMPAVDGSTSWAPWQTDLGTSGKKTYKILSIRVPRYELRKCRLCLSTWNMIKLGIIIH
jgi:hypothetical protein